MDKRAIFSFQYVNTFGHSLNGGIKLSYYFLSKSFVPLEINIDIKDEYTKNTLLTRYNDFASAFLQIQSAESILSLQNVNITKVNICVGKHMVCPYQNNILCLSCGAWHLIEYWDIPFFPENNRNVAIAHDSRDYTSSKSSSNSKLIRASRVSISMMVCI